MSDLPLVPQSDPHAFYRAHPAGIDGAVKRVLSSGWYILGPEVRAFEQEFAAGLEIGFAVGVANGTDALILALKALGIGHGDRVATVSMTAVATAAAIVLSGAEPVFVDVEPGTLTMDPQSLEATLKAVPGIRAVVPVHLYGTPANMPAIQALATQYGAVLVEDCAQAHGALLAGRPAGSFGDAASFSFYPTKNLGAFGDGGLVACRDPVIAARLLRLRQYGWDSVRSSGEVGMNSRLDEVQAAVLRYRLPFLSEQNARRRAIADRYRAALAGRGLGLPARRVDAVEAVHQFVVRTPRRDALAVHLKSRGIGTNIHYPFPVHRQPAYAGRYDTAPGGLAVTESAADSVLSLPMFPELTDNEVERVIAATLSFA